jgi:hypothetical protein
MPVNPETDYDYFRNNQGEITPNGASYHARTPAPQPEEIVYKPNSPHEWERGPQHVEPTSKIDYLGTAIDRVQVDNLEAIAWALIAIAEELRGRK